MYILTNHRRRFGVVEILDSVITDNNHTGAVYGAVAYRFGMEDGVRLCAEIEKITCPKQ